MNDLPEVSLVLPVHDAQARLASVVTGLCHRLSDADFEAEIILAEYGSTDRTARVAGQLSAQFPGVHSFCVGSVSPGTAQRRGIALARGRFVVCDAALGGDVDFIGRAIDRLRQDHEDVVVANAQSQLHPEAVRRAYDQLVGWGLGFGPAAPSGLIAFRRARVAPIAERCAMESGAFTAELVIRCQRQGLRVATLRVRGRETSIPALWDWPRVVGEAVQLRRVLGR